MTSLSQKFKEHFELILKSTLSTVDSEQLLNKAVKVNGKKLSIESKIIELSDYKKIFVIGVGKGSIGLFNGLFKILGNKINYGLIISGKEKKSWKKNIVFLKGDHPVPKENSKNAALKLKKFVKKINKDDLLISLITGGASAMVISPPKNIKYDNLSKLNSLLINSGASINEINCVRKHLSTIKGGRLARTIFPATIVTLYISDVIDSDSGTIGSGLFAGDSSSFADAITVLKKFSSEDNIGTDIIRFLKKGSEGKIEETPKPDDPIFKNNLSFIIGENLTALKAAKKRAEELGYMSKIIGTDEYGDVKKAAKKYGKIIKSELKNLNSYDRRRLLLFGGEFTVSITGKGRGGRVQEFLLLLLLELKDACRPFFIAGFGTDGRDGNSDAAGAWIDEKTFEKCEKKLSVPIVNYLANNDSNTFFKKIDQAIQTGSTGTNVMDVFFIFL